MRVLLGWVVCVLAIAAAVYGLVLVFVVGPTTLPLLLFVGGLFVALIAQVLTVPSERRR